MILYEEENQQLQFFLTKRHHTEEGGMNWHNFLELQEVAIDIKSFLKSINFAFRSFICRSNVP